MTSEEPTGEAGIIQMFTGTSLPSLWASLSPVAFPEGPGSVHLTIVMFLTSASKTCARLQARRLPRCESGLKVSKCSGKRHGSRGGQSQRAKCGDWHHLSGRVGPQHVYLVFPFWLVSCQRQQLFAQNSGLAQL